MDGPHSPDLFTGGLDGVGSGSRPPDLVIRTADGFGPLSPNLFAGRADGVGSGKVLHRSSTEPSERSEASPITLRHARELHRSATEPRSLNSATCEAVETGYLSPSPITRRKNVPDSGGYRSPSPNTRRRNQVDSFARPSAELRTPLPSLCEDLESDTSPPSSPTCFPGLQASPAARRGHHPRSRSAEAAHLISTLNELSAPIDCPPPARLRGGGAGNQLHRAWTDPSSTRSTRMNEAAETGYLSPSPGAVRRGTQLRRVPTDPETRRRLPSLVETPEHASISPSYSRGNWPMAHSAPQRMQRMQLNVTVPLPALAACSPNSNPSPPTPRGADVAMPLELGTMSLKAALGATSFLKIDEEQHDEAQDGDGEVEEDGSNVCAGQMAGAGEVDHFSGALWGWDLFVQRLGAGVCIGFQIYVCVCWILDVLTYNQVGST